MIKIAVLQIGYLGMDLNRLKSYLSVCQKEGVSLLLLGEYVLNPFFKAIGDTPVSMLKEQGDFHIRYFRRYAKEYNITIVAPIIRVKSSKLYKSIVKVSPQSSAYYEQQILINYSHWNEEEYFSNKKEKLKFPLIFKIDNVKFTLFYGYETHFDALWQEVMSRNIDVVLVPTLATFDSNERWKALLKTRAFTHGCYVVRANRIGEFKESKDETWHFYGHSFYVDPLGKIEEELNKKEELMIIPINKKFAREAKKVWGFKEAIDSISIID
jgi:predicted amidohydrolase